MTNNPTTSQFSITQAHLLTGKGKTTLRRHIDRGKLSATADEEGRRWIDGSELIRVYDLKPEDFERLEKPAKAVVEGSGSDRTTPDHQTESVREQLSTLTNERERERLQLQSQIDHLQEALKLAQEGHNRATLLLENQNAGGGGWEQAIATIERRLANQEAKAKKEHEELKATAKRQILQHKRALEANQQELEAERQKTLWQKLFG